MPSRFFSYELIGESFHLFSLSHLIMLTICTGGAALLYIFRDKLSKPSVDQSIRYLFAGLLFLSEVAFQLWHVYTGYWSSAYTLPLQLCSVSLLFCIWMLVTKSYSLFEITYFIGIGGAAQAMLTPELFYPFPHFRFVHFFLAHILIIWSCLYITWVHQYRPTIRSLWKTILFLNVLLVVALIVNRLTGGNYLFVSHKPTNPSLIDYLGAYPWYILSLEAVAIILFHLLYLPFVFSKKEDTQSPTTLSQ